MKQSIGFLLLTGLLFLGCAQQKKVAAPPARKVLPLAAVPPVETLRLSLQEPMALDGVTLTLQNIEDSRCPLNALCIWAGIAAVQVQLQDSTGAIALKTLYLGAKIPFSGSAGVLVRTNTPVALGAKTYQLVLTDVSPYPEVTALVLPEKQVKLSVRAL